MYKVTNRSPIKQSFVVRGDGGNPVDVSVDPGETKELALRNRNSPVNTSRESVGSVVIEGGEKVSSSSKTSKKGD